MSLWGWVVAACGIAYATKLAGYLLPDAWLDRPWVATVSSGMPAGLLASLVGVNTLGSGVSRVVDALPRLAVGGPPPRPDYSGWRPMGPTSEARYSCELYRSRVV